MAENSKIEWTTHTFNPWLGCTKVSPGCDNCYAEAMMDKRWGKVKWGPHGERKRTSESYWHQPLKWNAAAKRSEKRARVFCASLADVFDNKVPKAWREDLWRLIQVTPWLDWLLLTKRPQNVRKMLPADWGDGWSNVWLGTTCEDQKAFDQRWPILAEIPAVVRFISYEPAIGPIVMTVPPIPDWLICGGESGPNARMMAPEWARNMRYACAGVGTKFFMKQLGSGCRLQGVTGKGDDPSQWPADLRIREFPK